MSCRLSGLVRQRRIALKRPWKPKRQRCGHLELGIVFFLQCCMMWYKCKICYVFIYIYTRIYGLEKAFYFKSDTCFLLFFVVGRNCKKLKRSRERRLSPEELCFWVGSSEDFRLRSGMMQSQLAGLGTQILQVAFPEASWRTRWRSVLHRKGKQVKQPSRKYAIAQNET